jgi:hypothetical protein
MEHACCICAYMHAYTHACTCMHARENACIHVHTYTYIHTLTWPLLCTIAAAALRLDEGSAMTLCHAFSSVDSSDAALWPLPESGCRKRTLARNLCVWTRWCVKSCANAYQGTIYVYIYLLFRAHYISPQSGAIQMLCMQAFDKPDT